jgi:beta-glucanase (GH16 family)
MFSLLKRLVRAQACLAIAFAAVLATTAVPAGAAPPAADQTHVWQQSFGDDFNGIGLDPLKWSSCYWWVTGSGCTNASNNELQWYTPNNVVVSNGTVKLHAQKETVVAPDGKSYDYTSGMISTGRDSSLLSTPPKFQFKYGYMEMRAKAPAGAGLWSAFWTLPSSHGWPPEIDAMEMRGDRPNDVNVGVYNKDAAGNTVHGSTWVSPGADFTTGFHTFAVNWQPSSLDYYIDGVLRIRVTDPVRIPTEPMYVLADLAVGGNWPGAPTDATPFPSDLEIDYVKVWELKPDTTGPTVSITSPRSGSTVRRSTSVAVAANATDNVAVTKVDLYAGSTLLCSDSAAPYSCTWKTGTKRGYQTLTAKAYDPSGNVSTTSSTVYVS